MKPKVITLLDAKEEKLVNLVAAHAVNLTTKNHEPKNSHKIPENIGRQAK